MPNQSKFERESKALMEQMRKRYGIDSILIIAVKENVVDLGIGMQSKAEVAMGLKGTSVRAMPALLRNMANQMEKENPEAYEDKDRIEVLPPTRLDHKDLGPMD